MDIDRDTLLIKACMKYNGMPFWEIKQQDSVLLMRLSYRCTCRGNPMVVVIKMETRSITQPEWDNCMFTVRWKELLSLSKRVVLCLHQNAHGCHETRAIENIWPSDVTIILNSKLSVRTTTKNSEATVTAKIIEYSLSGNSPVAQRKRLVPMWYSTNIKIQDSRNLFVISRLIVQVKQWNGDC